MADWDGWDEDDDDDFDADMSDDSWDEEPVEGGGGRPPRAVAMFDFLGQNPEVSIQRGGSDRGHCSSAERLWSAEVCCCTNNQGTVLPDTADACVLFFPLLERRLEP